MADDYIHSSHGGLRQLAIPITIMAVIHAIVVVCVIEGIRKLYSVIQKKDKKPGEHST